MSYQGLGSYSNKAAADPGDRRPGESETAWRMRRQFWGYDREPEVEDQTWEEHRETVNSTPTGAGLLDGPQERAAALGSRGFGSGRELEKKGGLAVTAVPGSVAVGRVYAQDLGDQQNQPNYSPAHTLRSSGEGWMTR